MKTDLKIDLIENKNAKHHPPVMHKILPQHEFSMLIVAPKGSGKTNFICNMILKHYKGYFHRVIVCSPTVNNDPKWDIVKNTKNVLKRNTKLERALNSRNIRKKIKKVVFHTEESREKDKQADKEWDGKIPEKDFFSDMDILVPKYMDPQNAVIEKLKALGKGDDSKFIADRMLIVLDDQAGMFSGSNYQNPISNFVIKHRHFNSSVIIVTQAYKAIPKTIRSNCNALILFEIPNIAELKVIYEENPEGLKAKDWIKVVNYCTDVPYGFLYSNNHFPKGERLFKNFDSRISIAASSKEPEMFEDAKIDNK